MAKRVIFLLLLLSPILGLAQEKPEIIVYESVHCKVCQKVKKEVLPPIKEKYKGRVEWVHLSTLEPENLQQLFAVSQEFGRKSPLVPAVLAGGNLMVGAEEIAQGLSPSIEIALGGGSAVPVLAEPDLKEVFNKFSVSAVGLAGLIDGVNPCAFAVIVFFVSFLALYGYRRREIIYIGSSYCLAVFITYLLIGLGFFHFLYSLSNIYIFIKIFYWLIAGLCFVLAILSLRDYISYKRSGSAKDLSLQLPAFLKRRINAVIGSRLRDKNQRTPLELIGSAFLVGFFVSIFEAVCTGQVYLPIIVAILKYPELKARAFAYLVLYNLAFILPLLGIFLLSLAGFSSKHFNNFLKKHLGAIKILMALLFFSLGILILGYEYIYPYIFRPLKDFIIQSLR